MRLHLPVSVMYGTERLDPGSRLFSADICSWKIPTMPSKMKVKSLVLC